MVIGLALLAAARSGVSGADAQSDKDERADNQKEEDDRNQVPPVKTHHCQRILSRRVAAFTLFLLVVLLQLVTLARVALADAPSDQGEAPRQQGQNENHRDYIEQV